jgi:hypothetical protein
MRPRQNTKIAASDEQKQRSLVWWRGMDLNHGPSGYEPDELPDCSTPRCASLA